jgi:tellurite resistance protein
LSSSDFKKELEILKENLATSEEERDKYKEYAKSADSQKVKVMEEVNKKFQTQIDSLEKEVEEKDREHDLTIEEIH